MIDETKIMETNNYLLQAAKIEFAWTSLNPKTEKPINLKTHSNLKNLQLLLKKIFSTMFLTGMMIYIYWDYSFLDSGCVPILAVYDSGCVFLFLFLRCNLSYENLKLTVYEKIEITLEAASAWFAWKWQ